MRQHWGIVLLATAITGCGDTDEPASTNTAATAAASGRSTACDILTKQDAESAFGRSAERQPNEGGPAGLDICQYSYQGERLMDSGNVSVTVQRVDISSLKKGVLDQGYSIEPIPGLGDEAFWSREAGLYVGKGNRTAIYLLAVAGQKDSKPPTEKLARATAGRL
jgi:hypothetical protein